MKKRIKIFIPEPCHENWDQMTPTEKGKFCSVCTKEVIDFTQSSDEELIKRVMQGKNLCGRFKQSQLDREMTLERKSGTGLLPYAASFLMPLSVLSTNLDPKPKATEKSYGSLGIGSRTETPLKSIVTVSGYVTDVAGNPIRNAEIIIIEMGPVARTDSNGYYTLQCASGSTLFAQYNAMRSDDYLLGTKKQTLDVTLLPKVKTVSVTVGKLVTVPTEEVSTCSVDEGLEQDEQKIEATKVTVKGTVVDNHDIPLSGANVIIKEAPFGTQTNFDGYYEIEVEPNQTLVFTYVGFETQEIAVPNISNTINLKMNTGYLGGEVVIISGGVHIKVDTFKPYNPVSSFDDEQRQRRNERRDYAQKVRAFQKVKAARKKAARLLRRAERKKNNGKQ